MCVRIPLVQHSEGLDEALAALQLLGRGIQELDAGVWLFQLTEDCTTVLHARASLLRVPSRGAAQERTITGGPDKVSIVSWSYLRP